MNRRTFVKLISGFIASLLTLKIKIVDALYSITDSNCPSNNIRKVGNILTLKAQPTGGGPAGTKYKLEFKKNSNNIQDISIQTYNNVDLNNIITHLYTIIDEDIGNTIYYVIVSFVCPLNQQTYSTTIPGCQLIIKSDSKIQILYNVLKSI